MAWNGCLAQSSVRIWVGKALTICARPGSAYHYWDEGDNVKSPERLLHVPFNCCTAVNDAHDHAQVYDMYPVTFLEAGNQWCPWKFKILHSLQLESLWKAVIARTPSSTWCAAVSQSAQSTTDPSLSAPPEHSPLIHCSPACPGTRPPGKYNENPGDFSIQALLSV